MIHSLDVDVAALQRLPETDPLGISYAEAGLGRCGGGGHGGGGGGGCGGGCGLLTVNVSCVVTCAVLASCAKTN